MNPYVEAGYVVVLGTLGTYSVTLLARERAARRRVGVSRRAAGAGTAAAAADTRRDGAETAAAVADTTGKGAETPAAAPSDERASRALP